MSQCFLNGFEKLADNCPRRLDLTERRFVAQIVGEPYLSHKIVGLQVVGGFQKGPQITEQRIQMMLHFCCGADHVFNEAVDALIDTFG